jgi:phosphomannomutase
MEITIQDLMDHCGVKFGTSGARGLAEDMTDFVCYAYTQGFLQFLKAIGDIKPGQTEVAIAGDLRPSTDRIMRAVAQAAEHMGYTPVNCGKVPSPAVALYGIVHQMPSIMVTGSHIPADRNGIKFNRCAGEVLKQDEVGIRGQSVCIDDALFLDTMRFREPFVEPWPVSHAARDMYLSRYLDLFPPDCLQGQRIGVYQHSAVGRDMMLDIVQGLGATAVALAPSETFIPVDTEAIRPEDVSLAAQWAQENEFTAIISTDGDSDRPLLADEQGQWLRGDIAGILCARYLQADSVSTPVSCNTALEKSGHFSDVRRTRIGSPYVIASMIQAGQAKAKTVVGYEANGGFLIQTDVSLFGKTLQALPTRDAMILLLSILIQAKAEGKCISELSADLPARFTCSDRLQNFPQEQSQAILAKFTSGSEQADLGQATEIFGSLGGACCAIDRTDGVRMTFANDEIIHLRPSGNAPEFRCYTEAATDACAAQLNTDCMQILRNLADA